MDRSELSAVSRRSPARAGSGAMASTSGSSASDYGWRSKAHSLARKQVSSLGAGDRDAEKAGRSFRNIFELAERQFLSGNTGSERDKSRLQRLRTGRVAVHASGLFGRRYPRSRPVAAVGEMVAKAHG